ncbi:MAG: hypothetical protein ABSE08_06205 [Syntrophobacteraceae bacterium]|jgi:hypothetical protein
MKSINRNIVIIKAKEPFLDWLRKLPDPDTEITLEFLRSDCLSFLIPETSSEDEVFAWIGKHYEAIFEAELFSWHTLEQHWPKSRTFAKFKDWFDVEFHSEVIDLVDLPIVKEDFIL